MGVVVEMRSPGAVVQEPRVCLAHHALDELLGVGAPVVVEQGEDRDGDFLDLLEPAVAGRMDEALVEGHVLHPFGAVLAIDDFGKEVRVPPLGVHVRHREEAVEVVEADVLWLALLILAHVPLPDRLRHVAGVGEELWERDLPGEPARHAVHGWNQEAVSHRQPARHDGGTGGRARRLAVTGGEEQAVPGDPVDVGCRCSHRHTAAVAPEVPPADVVHQDDHDVGSPACTGEEVIHLCRSHLVAAGHHEGGLPVRPRCSRGAGHRIHA